MRTPAPVLSPARRRHRAGRPRGLAAALLVGWAALVLPACGGEPKPVGELNAILDSEYRIAHPGRVGASATGSGCGPTAQKALTTAQRVAQFNLRSLTGEARYSVRFDPIGQTRSEEGICVEVSATAVPSVPYER